MEYIIAVIALLFGVGAGYLFARSRGKGERISQKLQEKISSQEHDLQSLQSRVATAKGELKSTEAEAKSKAKEIIADAKLIVQKERSELEKEQARMEEHEKMLKKSEAEIGNQRINLEKKQEEVAKPPATVTPVIATGGKKMSNTQLAMMLARGQLKQ